MRVWSYADADSAFVFRLSPHSEESPKGSECYETFKTMQDCFAKYPAVYDKGGSSPDDADLDAAMAESEVSSGAATADSAETVAASESAVDPQAVKN